MPFIRKFLLFKPLSYCFEKTMGFDIEASFASRPVPRQSGFITNQVT